MGRKAKKAAKRKLEGCDTDESQKKKTTHEKLASTIKGLHWKLRRKFRANQDNPDSVWKQHQQDVASLQEYAQAMHQLATQHWTEAGTTRIDWCRDVVKAYFFEDGYTAAVAKDVRRSKFFEERNLLEKKDISPCDQTSHNASAHVSDFPSGANKLITGSDLITNTTSNNCLEKLDNKTTFEKDSLEAQEKTSCEDSASQNLPNLTSGCSDESIQLSYFEANNLSRSDSLTLLDVGSCYDPFSAFPEFQTVAIDLCPATSSVLQCDFLGLEITTKPCTFAAESDIKLKHLTSPLKSLPECSFDVVVFSLLLEYLPSPRQRWQCCLKAQQLLQHGGLLLIITPDSNCVNKNAPMMKNWKTALEAIGLRRWKYVKQKHVHCMAYRKTKNQEITKLCENDHVRYSEMMSIPQDFTTDPDDKDLSFNVEETSPDEQNEFTPPQQPVDFTRMSDVQNTLEDGVS